MQSERIAPTAKWTAAKCLKAQSATGCCWLSPDRIKQLEHHPASESSMEGWWCVTAAYMPLLADPLRKSLSACCISSHVAADNLVHLTTHSGYMYDSALPKQAVGSLKYWLAGCWESKQADTHTSSVTTYIAIFIFLFPKQAKKKEKIIISMCKLWECNKYCLVQCSSSWCRSLFFSLTYKKKHKENHLQYT